MAAVLPPIHVRRGGKLIYLLIGAGAIAPGIAAILADLPLIYQFIAFSTYAHGIICHSRTWAVAPADPAAARHRQGIAFLLIITGQVIYAAFHIIAGERPAPVNGVIIVALRNDHIIVFLAGDDHRMAVARQSQNVTHADVLPFDVGDLPGGAGAEGRVTQHQGKAVAAITAGIHSAIPFVVIIIGPGHALGIVLFEGKHPAADRGRIQIGQGKRRNQNCQQQYADQHKKPFFHSIFVPFLHEMTEHGSV